jgi:HEAT repeat protein
MLTRRLLLALPAVLAAAGTAFAHGGAYRGPGNAGGPGGPPPGPSDDPAPVTQWETWWANNKYLHLRLGEGMRESTGAVTGGGARTERDDEGRVKEARQVREELDAIVRDLLVPLFVAGLQDPSFEVRTAAAVALGKTGDPSGVEPLQRAAAKDDHPDVRDAALLGLGLLGQPKALPGLRDIVRDEQATTRHRSFAAFSTGLVGGKEAAATLVEWMRLRDGSLRHRGDAPFLASCLLAMGFTGEDDVIPVLRQAFRDREYDEQTRAFALLALGRCRDRESLGEMVATLGDPQGRVAMQRAAAVALGKVAHASDNSAVVTLFDAVRSNRDPLVRHFAAVTLGGLADTTVRGELRRAFARADDADRAFLALALGIASDLESAPALRKALASERNESQRGAFAIALGLMEDKGAKEVLEAQVRDRGAIWPAGYASLAIGMARITESAPALRKALEETNDPRLRANVAAGLGLLHDPVARKWFFDTVKGKGSMYERGGAAMALGMLRINEAVPLLVGVSRDTDEQDLMRAYAVVALGILADPTDPPKLARFSIDHDYSLVNDPVNEVLTIY